MAAKTKKGKSPARKDTLLRRFGATVGRERLKGALDASMEPRALALLGMMADPLYRKHSFAKLCEKAGLNYRDVFDLFRRAQLDVGMIRMLSSLPKVMEDTAQDALSRSEACPKCDGRGKVSNDGEPERPCSKCAGTGSVKVSGAATARAQIFEMAGLTGKRRKSLK